MLKANYEHYIYRLSRLVQIYSIVAQTTLEEAYVNIRSTSTFKNLEANDDATMYEGISSNLNDIFLELIARRVHKPKYYKRLTNNRIIIANKAIRDDNIRKNESGSKEVNKVMDPLRRQDIANEIVSLYKVPEEESIANEIQNMVGTSVNYMPDYIYASVNSVRKIGNQFDNEKVADIINRPKVHVLSANKRKDIINQMYEYNIWMDPLSIDLAKTNYLKDIMKVSYDKSKVNITVNFPEEKRIKTTDRPRLIKIRKNTKTEKAASLQRDMIN